MTHHETRFIPVGGVGEFGANASILKTSTTTVLIDFGLMFPPDSRKPGVDYYVVNPQKLLAAFPDIQAIFLTHGHEDHIGGLPHLLPHRNLPVFALPYTARLVAEKFHDQAFTPVLQEVELNQAIPFGDIQVTFLGVTHSIQHACSLAIDTPAGRLIHSGDFKVDPLPEDNHPFQSEHFRQWGKKGVDILLMDSTNATKPGFCPSDQALLPHWENIISQAQGRVFFATFSSHMPRVKKIIKLAAKLGRKVAFLGRSLKRHMKIAVETGYLGLRADVMVSFEQAMKIPEDTILFVMTGSQGEPRSATARILRNDYKGLAFNSRDTVIFASKAIPGNERQMALLCSDMERKGITVVTGKDQPVHASGHAYREELAYLLCLTNPKTAIPIHGEFHHLLKHFQWLNQIMDDHGQLLLIEDGDQVVLDSSGTRLEQNIRVELLPIDGNQELPLENSLIRQRKDMMYSGLLIIAWHHQEKSAEPLIQVSTCGMVLADPDESMARITVELQRMDYRQYVNDDLWASTLRKTARSVLRQFFYGRPLIKCIVNGNIF